MLVAAQLCSRADRGLAFARSRLLTAAFAAQVEDEKVSQPDRQTGRGPLAVERLTESGEEQVLYQFRGSWTDGSTALLLARWSCSRAVHRAPRRRGPWSA